MSLRRSSYIVAALLAGCIDATVVPCGDLICPGGLVCTPAGCTTPEAAAVCDGIADATPCTTQAITAGACGGGACHAITCGDGVIDPGEVCDDGNTAAADGCSATCNSDETCGNQVIDVVSGEECDDGRAGLSGDGCSSSCRREFATWHDVSPVAIAPRAGHAMATDRYRNVVVLFGGYDVVAARADTWEWDGETWTQRFPSRSPPPRYGHSLAYDADTRVTVLFGGTGLGGELDDTWTWDGTTWTQVQTPIAPGRRAYAAMAYDSVRKRIVLEGGYAVGVSYPDTWEWDGSAWTQQTMPSPGFVAHAMAFDPSPGEMVMVAEGNTYVYSGVRWVLRPVASPPDVRVAAMTYDAARDRIVFYGGRTLNTTVESAEIWEWDGSQWTHLTPASPPVARGEAAIAFHSKTSESVMFGGFTHLGAIRLLPETHTWNGSTWTNKVQPAPAPSARAYGALSYDPKRGRALMFGGYDTPSGILFNELWQWRDRRWIQQFPGTSVPSPRSEHGQAFDPIRDRLVVFGGTTSGPTTTGDTWELEGVLWTKLVPATSPTARRQPMMTFDGRTSMLFGGLTASGASGETWTWDGVTWHLRSPAAAPSPRSGGAVAYDPARDRLVLFGGRNGNVRFADTWEWDGSTWVERTPAVSPLPREYLSMSYDARLGEVVLFGGYSGTAYLGDLWTWDGARWRAVQSQSPVPERAGHKMVYDAVLRATVLFGGETFAGDDIMATSVLSYEAPIEPAESCSVATSDDDRDGLTGCADPDCWGRCTPWCGPHQSCDPSLPRCGDGSCGATEDVQLCPSDCL